MYIKIYINMYIFIYINIYIYMYIICIIYMYIMRELGRNRRSCNATCSNANLAYSHQTTTIKPTLLLYIGGTSGVATRRERMQTFELPYRGPPGTTDMY